MTGAIFCLISTSLGNKHFETWSSEAEILSRVTSVVGSVVSRINDPLISTCNLNAIQPFLAAFASLARHEKNHVT